MALADFLRPDSVLLSPQAADKWQLIRQMVDGLVGAGHLPFERRDEAVAALDARERSVSTGMEQGIAVPHAALDELDGVRAALAVIPEGLDFQSLDQLPARIVVLLLVPRQEKLLHVRTLTEVARRLGDSAFRQRILDCRSGAELIGLWA
ncbi:MAG: PTS sugar transporter subunit IIA [Planctomycetes bacterium]|nr:PTS sugar transporter subunit IIA [Planctomycetota bacterium]MBL7008126.1 PTS sugar transporter subunit IIA [Planctomycetota bacterium]